MKSETKVILGLIVVCLIVCVTMLVTAISKLEEANNISPVENNGVIESATTANDSLMIVVNNLDSIKNAKIIEVKGLDNDSTLKLFYKLVSE